MRQSVIEVFNQHQNLINKLSWSYHRSTGVEFEEIKNQARFLFFKAYKKYDSTKKIKFITYLYTVLKNDLHKFCIKYARTVCVDQEILEQEPTNLDPSILTGFKIDVLEGLSDDAKEIIDLVLKDHKTVDFRQSHTQIRLSIKSFLKEEYKWSTKTILSAFKELKHALK
jgi:DNA-directed RNA polymerase specialized sigma24 family protein